MDKNKGIKFDSKDIVLLFLTLLFMQTEQTYASIAYS